MPYWYQTFTETFPDAEDYYVGFGDEAAGRFNDLSQQMWAIANGLDTSFDTLINAYDQRFRGESERLAAGWARGENEIRTGRDATLASMDRATGAAAGRVAGGLAGRGLGNSSVADAAVNEVYREGELDKGRVREEYGGQLADYISRGATTQAQFNDSGNRFIAGARMNQATAVMGAKTGALDLKGQGVNAWMGAKSSWLNRRYADPIMMRKPRPFWHAYASMGATMAGTALGSYFGGPAGGMAGGQAGAAGAQAAGWSGGEG